ncbi:tRNA modification GTPase GTPBP3, mitochondrial [Cylas formicarius]|uniref:tRNA modification GTPase GTPBP3, mitochondrial n=1 Tax=Cylas formicarius TaxID=197179 RepID=UPI002958459B|nr:tRNA modification GTPase GTPBP3, mitochondrial [Cylas formicarius]
MCIFSNFKNITCHRFARLYRYYSHTIFALSSGQGKCGVAVIRVSGHLSETALKELASLKSLPPPRTTLLRSLRHPKSKEILDRGLVIWFPGPRSFTGEDSCEFHVHGGLAVVNGMLDALSCIPSFRLAEPGEFTKRAFQNGKLNLTEVEGLADLLQAETEAQRKQAFLQTNGSLSKLYQKWKAVLLKNVAHIEAHIDFEETETLEHGLIDKVTSEAKLLIEEIEQHLNDGRKGEILRNGVNTVIIGEPNVGKSSLLNSLVERPASIVTPISGTTRDVVAVTLNVKGYPLVLSDTAGIRTISDDIVENEGIKRTLKSYKESDLVILVVDFEKYHQWAIINNNAIFMNYLMYYVRKLNVDDLTSNSDKISDMFTKHCIVVLNKCDLDENNICDNLQDGIVKVSCINKNGLSTLVDCLADKLKLLCGDPSQEHPSMNQRRHRQQVTECLRNLKLFLQEMQSDTHSHDVVIMAEYLRKSLRSLGKLVGTVSSEEILDVVFSQFCIGK